MNWCPSCAKEIAHADAEGKCPPCGALAQLRADLVPTGAGIKHDSDKPRMELLPMESLEQIALVLNFGAKKYDSWNWAKGLSYSRLAGAALRHLAAWLRGEDKDKESGLSHLAHAGCCVLFMIWMQSNRPELDDRFKGNK